jgi:hypothetical protein
MYIFILKKNHIDTFGNTLYDLRIKHYTPFGDKWRGYLQVFVLRMLKQLEMSGVWNIDDTFTASIGSVVSVLLAVSQDWRP